MFDSEFVDISCWNFEELRSGAWHQILYLNIWRFSVKNSLKFRIRWNRFTRTENSSRTFSRTLPPVRSLSDLSELLSVKPPRMISEGAEPAAAGNKSLVPLPVQTQVYADLEADSKIWRCQWLSKENISDRFCRSSIVYIICEERHPDIIPGRDWFVQSSFIPANLWCLGNNNYY